MEQVIIFSIMEQEKLNKSFLTYSLLICIFLAHSSCSTSYFKNDLSKILGIKDVEIENSQLFEEWAGVQGDGFILEIYTLSEKSVQSFEETSNKELPSKMGKNNIWHKYDWSSIPVDSSYSEIFIVCLNYFSSSDTIKIQLRKIQEIMCKEDVYYSFYYKPNKDNPQSVQLFVLDIQYRKLYAIDQQI